MTKKITMIIPLIVGSVAAIASAQSSSLYVPPATAPIRQPVAAREEVKNPLSPAVAQLSLSAVPAPEPRKFAVHDLVTIVVRETTESDSEAKMETKKDVAVKAGVTEFPSVNINDLLKAYIGGSTLTNPPKLNASANNEFKGDGSYTRKDSITSRVTAKIIDVKPNGTLVLEARKSVQTDGETLELVLSGVCRKDDVLADNTVLSTQLADLNISKQHTGELKKATKKGLLTRLVEAVFNF